mgnify:CR=1 FL=1
MKKIDQFFEMVQLQKELDQKILKKTNQNFSFIEVLYNNLFAIGSEAQEIQNCFYWKHWTKESLEKRFDLLETPEHLLIEVVDILHFILQVFYNVSQNFSDKKIKDMVEKVLEKYTLEKEIIIDTTIHRKVLILVYDIQSILYEIIKEYEENEFKNLDKIFEMLKSFLAKFWTLATSLGFSFENVYNAYKKKNRLNHERQQKGYSQKKIDDSDNIELEKELKLKNVRQEKLPKPNPNAPLYVRLINWYFDYLQEKLPKPNPNAPVEKSVKKNKKNDIKIETKEDENEVY